MNDYGVFQVFADAFSWGRLQINTLVNDWGMTGVGVLVAFGVIWKLFLRAR
jgi:hypothetical protein